MGELSSNLDLQRKSCRCVVGVIGVKDGRVCRFLPNEFNIHTALDGLASDGFRYYAIKHDKDSEYEHYHLVLFSTKTLRLKQFLNAVVDNFGCDAVNVCIRETTNVQKNIQYLIHKNEGNDKHKYSIDEIFTNDDKEQLRYILSTDENQYDELISSENLIDIVKYSKNITEIYYKVGFKFFNTYLRVIRMLIKEYHCDWSFDL